MGPGQPWASETREGSREAVWAADPGPGRGLTSSSRPLSRGRVGDGVTRKDQTGGPGAWAPSFRKLCRLNLASSCDHCSLLGADFWGFFGESPRSHSCDALDFVMPATGGEAVLSPLEVGFPSVKGGWEFWPHRRVNGDRGCSVPSTKPVISKGP